MLRLEALGWHSIITGTTVLFSVCSSASTSWTPGHPFCVSYSLSYRASEPQKLEVLAI